MSISLVPITPHTIIPKYKPVIIPNKVVAGDDAIVTYFLALTIEDELAIAYDVALKNDPTLDKNELVDKVYDLLKDFIAQRTNPKAINISTQLASIAIKNYSQV